MQDYRHDIAEIEPVRAPAAAPADRGLAGDDQAALGERRPEVMGLGVHDHDLGVALPGQDRAGHLFERDRFRPTDIRDANQRFADRHWGRMRLAADANGLIRLQRRRTMVVCHTMSNWTMFGA